MTKRIGRVFKYAILIAGAVVMIFPFFWSFMTS
ncbi:MAG: ABC-type sugar transport system, permease component, partial [Mesotoga infera]